MPTERLIKWYRNTDDEQVEEMEERCHKLATMLTCSPILLIVVSAFIITSLHENGNRNSFLAVIPLVILCLFFFLLTRREHISRYLQKKLYPDYFTDIVRTREEFHEALVNELRHPSENCAIGDIQFGMTAADIYHTKLFKGIAQEDEIPQENYFQNQSVCATYGIYDFAEFSFIMENNKLKAIHFEWKESLRGRYPFTLDDDEENLDAEDVLDRNLIRLKSMYGMSLRVGKKHIISSCSSQGAEGEFLVIITQD